MREKLDVLADSGHKEASIGARKQHESTIAGLVVQLEKYCNPFLVGPARHLKTGVEIDHDIVNGLLMSGDAGEKQFREFADFRLKATGDERVNFFDSIVKLKIKTGLEKVQKPPKAVSILKEDRQAFGVLVEKQLLQKEPILIR